jgi:hypothetical protein
VTTDESGITDEVKVELNPKDEPAASTEARLAQQEPSLPSRPADSASKSAWVDYVVALGADRSVAEDLRYYDARGRERLEVEDFVGGYDDEPAEAVQVDVGGYTTRKALTRAELIELADRLGG